jgi:peptidoglycan/LPS O-acetylase OafA/YrhL
MPWWSYFVYLQNFMVPIPTRAAGLLGVTWSLAVEEQFYLVWPLVVRFCNEATLRRMMIAIIFLDPVLRFVMLHRGLNVYSNTFCRLDALMWGGLLASLLRSRTLSPANHVRKAWIVLLIAAPLAFITANRANWIVYSFTAAASVSFLYVALNSKQKWLQAALSNRFLVYSGMISYGIYLLQKIPVDALKLLHWQRHPAAVLPVTAVATYFLATASWYLLERPAMKWKRFFVTSETNRSAPQVLLAEAS